MSFTEEEINNLFNKGLEGVATGAGTEVGEVFMGLILSDFTENQEGKINEKLNQIEEKIDTVNKNVNYLVSNDNTSNLFEAIRNLETAIHTIKISPATDKQTNKDNVNNITHAISSLDSALTPEEDAELSTDPNNDKSGIYAIANMHFNNFTTNTSSVCELLYRDLQRFWGLRARAIYYQYKTNLKYDLGMGFTKESLVEGHLKEVNSQGTIFQQIVNQDFHTRYVEIPPVYSFDENTKVNRVSAFTWFGFVSPNEKHWGIGVNHKYDIPWCDTDLYAPLESKGYMLDNKKEIIKGPVEHLGVGYIGQEGLPVANNGIARGLGWSQCGNQFVPVISDSEKWYGEFSNARNVMKMLFDFHDWVTGLCTFEEGSYLNSWSIIFQDCLEPDCGRNRYSPQIQWCDGIAGDYMPPMALSQVPTLDDLTTYKAPYFDLMFVGPTMKEEFSAPITGVCFLQRGNRYGYIAQSRVHLNAFEKPIFDGAKNIQDVLNHLKS